MPEDLLSNEIGYPVSGSLAGTFVDTDGDHTHEVQTFRIPRQCASPFLTTYVQVTHGGASQRIPVRIGAQIIDLTVPLQVQRSE